MRYQTIPIRQLDYVIDSGFDGIIIDLRNASSYEQGHIRGAINIPFDQINDYGPGNLPSDRILMFYCSRGSESMLICNYLSREGYRVLNVSNGISSYRGKYLVKE